MLASEFRERLDELIAAVGDVEVVIETGSNGNGSSLFKTAAIEAQFVKPMSTKGNYRSTKTTNTQLVIKVW